MISKNGGIPKTAKYTYFKFWHLWLLRCPGFRKQTSIFTDQKKQSWGLEKMCLFENSMGQNLNRGPAEILSASKLQAIVSKIRVLE